MKRAWEPAPARLFGLILACGAASTHAAEWSLSPTFALSVDHDSNRDLVAEPTPSEGASMSADVQLQYASERATLSLHPQVWLQHFDTPTFQDTNDVALAASGNWLGERSTLAFTGLASDLSLLTTELPLTGIVAPGTRERTESGGASWTYSQTERLALSLQANYIGARYQSESAGAAPLLGYHGTTLGATESLQRSERLGLYVTATDSSFSQQGVPALAHTQGVVLGFKSQLSERTTLSIDGGASRTTLLSMSSDGFLGDLTLSRKTETGSISLSASRTVAPAGFGEITAQDTVRAALQRDLSSRLSIDAALSLNRYSNVFNIPGLISIDLTYLDHTYSQLAIGLNWQQTETWTLAAHVYGNRAQSPVFPTADGWQVRLQSSWTPRAYKVSR